MAGKLVASVPLVASGRGWEVRRDTEHLIVNLLPPLVWTNIGINMVPDITREGAEPARTTLLRQRKIIDRSAAETALDSAFAAVFA
jgi:hypothetical protein